MTDAGVLRYSRLRKCQGISTPAFLFVLFLVALAITGFARTVDAQQTDRAKALSQKMMCVCGCNQVLGACNHVGCQYSHAMIKEIDDRVTRGDSDDLILQSFVQEYGQTVLLSPPAKGFNLVAWIMPVAVPIFALALVCFAVLRWRQNAELTPASGPPISPEILSRIRRQEESDDDGARDPGKS